MGKAQYFLRWLCPPLDSLYIHCNDIGGGFLIQHGFATIITAERIGKNAKIFQQVTIGYNEDKLPIIGDNVEVCCGAKVIGGVTVGNDVTVGAQALVIKDVEDNVVVGGVPARVLKTK
jgi:serine O-acetyltransferase